MKLKIFFSTIFGLIVFYNSSAQQIPLDSLDLQIHQLIKDFDIPGLSIGIVRNDSIIFSKGYGILEKDKERQVDENTIFGIGSISKSFTALTLGILVDEGKIDWDDKVIDYLPYFELYAPYVTDNFTIRDLLTHRSGLTDVSGGTLWYHSDYSREEVIKRLKYLEPITGFREKPAYQNVMYVVASEIVKTVSGMSWDNFVKNRVFDKLEMSNTTSLSAERESNANLAQPHIWNEDYEKVAIEQENGDNLAPGGFIYSSSNEMSNYMRLMLNNGTFGNDTIVNPKIIDEIFKPQIIYPLGGAPFYNEFTSYGFGWWLTPINGHKIIEHSGGIDGMSANLVMIKDMNLGFVILTNEAEEPATFLLTAKILEMIFDDKSYDIYSRVLDNRNQNLKKKKESPVQISKTPKTKPSLEIQKYAGKYSDKMYGDILINYTKNGELEISFSHSPVFNGKLAHWHFDTFKIDWNDIRVPDGFLTFNFNAYRDILGFSMDQENLLDVDFGELKILKNKN
ncbi:CubicO group peptidase, beta-lactamase class C family [Flavobacteriaceae bacterium MAR_2010_188]|nr:CubicO group peptidase, beta-lactamase class C family [Flavobacteriaceae bacterium MAR_2010_188]